MRDRSFVWVSQYYKTHLSAPLQLVSSAPEWKKNGTLWEVLPNQTRKGKIFLGNTFQEWQGKQFKLLERLRKRCRRIKEMLLYPRENLWIQSCLVWREESLQRFLVPVSLPASPMCWGAAQWDIVSWMNFLTPQEAVIPCYVVLLLSHSSACLN